MSEQVEVKSMKVEKTETKDKASQMKKLDLVALKLLSTRPFHAGLTKSCTADEGSAEYGQNRLTSMQTISPRDS